MSVEKTTNEVSQWLSTYGIITAERMLSRFHIQLNTQELMAAVKNPHCIYHKLLRIPVKNILNGIILQQAKDYQIYVQKLFIDYLLSGEAGKEATSPGGATRQALEEQRKEMVAMGEQFQKDEMKHLQLIADSQKFIIDGSKKWHESFNQWVDSIYSSVNSRGVSKELVLHVLRWMLILPSDQPDSAIALRAHCQEEEVKLIREAAGNQLAEFNTIDLNADDFTQRIHEITQIMDTYRNWFYEAILTATDKLTQLPEYRFNLQQVAENKEQLKFDKNIGHQDK